MGPGYLLLAYVAGAGLRHIWAFLNSNFAIGLIAALAGSFAGAYGAQWIVEREGRRRRTLEELRATNAAISLSLFTVNAILALKRQHLRGVISNFRALRDRFNAVAEKPNGETFAFTADWKTFPWTEVPIAALTDLVFNRIDAVRPITLLSMLSGVLGHLQGALEQREEIAEQIRGRPSISPAELACLYFGLRGPDGRLDSRYPDLLDAAENYADSAILFGTVLVEELIKHGEATARRLGKGAPHVVRANFQPAHDDGLLPDPREFAAVLRPMGINPDTALNSVLLGSKGIG